MKILYVADGRSPIAQNWIRHFAQSERGDDVYLASTFACSLDFPVNGLEITPVAFSSVKKASQRPGTASARTVGLRTAIRTGTELCALGTRQETMYKFIEEMRGGLTKALQHRDEPFGDYRTVEKHDG